MLNEVKPNLDLLMSIRLRLAEQYGIPPDVPFRDYKAWYRWTGMEVPAQTMQADFVNQLYSKEGKPCRFEDIFKFERLSKAWDFIDGELNEYEVGEARFSGKGLLIESQATNVIRDNTFTSATVSQPTRVSLTDVVDNSIPDAKLLTSKVEWSSRSGALTNLQNQDDYPLGITLPIQDGYYYSYIMKNSGGARYASLYSTDTTGHGAVIDFVEGVQVGTKGSIRNLGGGWFELRRWSAANSGAHEKQFRVAFGNTLNGSNLITEIGDNVFVAYPSAYDAKDIDLSVIPTYGTPTTRLPETLTLKNSNQPIVVDADEGIIQDGTTFSGFGHIRKIEVK